MIRFSVKPITILAVITGDVSPVKLINATNPAPNTPRWLVGFHSGSETAARAEERLTSGFSMVTVSLKNYCTFSLAKLKRPPSKKTVMTSGSNRSFLKKRRIRFSGKLLGRPEKITPENRDELKYLKVQSRQEHRERIPIEGKFGQGKYGYRLNNIRARRVDMCVIWINSIFLVMSLLALVWVFIRMKKLAAKMAI